jgi:hypothetical protein
MKYILILFALISVAACNSGDKTPTGYDLANNAIDSILEQNMQLRNMAGNLKPGDDPSPYYMAVINRYTFAKIYEMELNKLPPSIKKNELITRYNKEIHTEIYDFFPDDLMDQARKDIFHSNTN